MTFAKWLLLGIFLLCWFGCASIGSIGSDKASLDKGTVQSQEAPAAGPDEHPEPTTAEVQYSVFSTLQHTSPWIHSEESVAVAAYHPRTQGLLKRGRYQEEQAGLVEGSVTSDADAGLGIEDHPRVDYFVRFFQEDSRKNFERGLARSTKYLPMMRKIFREEGLSERLAYIALIESGFTPHAYSPRGAGGIWQFMGGTGRKFGLRIDWWVDERRDPEKSTRAAAKYLKYLHEMFGAWDLAIAAYNAGEGKIERCMRHRKEDTFWGLCEGKGLRRETKDFVPKFLAASKIAQEPKVHGFLGVPYEEPWEFDVVSVSDPLDLETIARLADATAEEIRELNPQLRRWCSPPGPENTELRVPKGTGSFFSARLAKLPPSEQANIKVHRVRNGESLWTIARRYGSRVDLIQRFNRLPSASRIRAGATLMIPLPNGEGLNPIAAAERGYTENALVSSNPLRDGIMTTEDGVIIHRVKSGDTLWSISRRYGVCIADILRWNSLGSHRIWPGDTLKLIQKQT